MDCRLYQERIKRSKGRAAVLLLLSLTASAAHSQTAADWRDSLAVLSRQIEAQGRRFDVDLHLRKAAVNLELQQWNYAIEEYSSVLQHEPKNLAALFYRAYANQRLRHHPLAAADYKELLGVVPRHFEARLSLAYVYQQMGKKTDATDELNRLVELFPDSASAYVARGNFEREQGQADVAVYDFEQAVRLQPEHREYRLSYAEALISAGRKKEARRELDELVRRGVPRGMLREWYAKL